MSLDNAPLGHDVAYPGVYDPTLLFPIDRAENRAALGLSAGSASLPFIGGDIWNAYELSWLNPRGKPELAIAVFEVPADTPRIIESKSFKLYLNSYNQTRLDSVAQLRTRLATDLTAAAGGPVGVQLILPEHFGTLNLGELAGESLDSQDVAIDTYHPAPELLEGAARGEEVEELLTSRLLKSNCPVTGQPDWGSVQIHYRGSRIDRARLLAYIVSFREHAEFHEHCVERMFVDIMRACRPQKLSVYARYTRRGGLDINPWRATPGAPAPENLRNARQ